MRSILVPVEECAGLQAQLATALLAAAPFGGHLDGVAPRFLLAPPYVGGPGIGVVAPLDIEQFDHEEKTRVDQAAAAFRAFMRERKIVWSDPGEPSAEVTASWIAEIAQGDDAIGQLARVHDVTVLARPTAKTPVPRAELLEAVVFDSGRPILVAPPETPDRLGEVILIAWIGSAECARTIKCAEPFLHRARRIAVLAVEGEMVPGPDTGQVQHALRRRGIAAEAISVRPEKRQVGEAILAEAANLRADLLLKGAYTHSRLRHMIFGGATSHILTQATLPVLMAH